jgi:hypothetical protein
VVPYLAVLQHVARLRPSSVLYDKWFLLVVFYYFDCKWSVMWFSRNVVYIVVPSFRCLRPDGFNFLVVLLVW